MSTVVLKILCVGMIILMNCLIMNISNISKETLFPPLYVVKCKTKFDKNLKYNYNNTNYLHCDWVDSLSEDSLFRSFKETKNCLSSMRVMFYMYDI